MMKWAIAKDDGANFKWFLFHLNKECSEEAKWSEVNTWFTLGLQSSFIVANISEHNFSQYDNKGQTTTPGTSCPTLLDKRVGSFTSPANHINKNLERRFQSFNWNKQKYPTYSAGIVSKAELKGTTRYFLPVFFNIDFKRTEHSWVLAYYFAFHWRARSYNFLLTFRNSCFS